VNRPSREGPAHHILSVSFTELQLEPVIAAAHERGVSVTLAGSAQRFEQFAATAESNLQSKACAGSLPRSGHERGAQSLRSQPHLRSPSTSEYLTRRELLASALAAGLLIACSDGSDEESSAPKATTRM
jgi:hypothetical protein